MTQLKYRPSDFREPVIGERTYAQVFGKPQWELCAEYIMRYCIEAGYWKPVPVLLGRHHPISMMSAGFLEHVQEEGFILTDSALERIIERFPAQF